MAFCEKYYKTKIYRLFWLRNSIFFFCVCRFSCFFSSRKNRKLMSTCTHQRALRKINEIVESGVYTQKASPVPNIHRSSARNSHPKCWCVAKEPDERVRIKCNLDEYSLLHFYSVFASLTFTRPTPSPTQTDDRPTTDHLLSFFRFFRGKCKVKLQ